MELFEKLNFFIVIFFIKMGLLVLGVISDFYF